MIELLIVAVLALAVLAVLAYRRAERRKRTASTCGQAPHPGGTLDPAAWHIGPRLPGDWGNRSPGMPEHPAPAPDGWQIDLPIGVDLPLGEGPKVGYLTFRHGPLTGKRRIRMRYRLEMDPDVRVLAVPEIDPASHIPARLTLYFQREGDDWSGRGEFEAYRWWHTAAIHYLAEGEHEIVAPLGSGWSAVETSTLASNWPGFLAAIDETCCVGFVLGGNEIGLGHGARATGKARMTVTHFQVED